MDPDAVLRQRFPFIVWSEPINVTVEGATRLGCRFCIARFGLRGSDVDRLYETREGWENHMALFHTQP